MWDTKLYLKCVVLNMWLIVKAWNVICDEILGQVMLRDECWNDVNCAKLSLLYLYYICVFIYLYLFTNVITHSLCFVCVWILSGSQSLCSWEQITRWITLKNLVLGDVRTQCSNRMWHWSMSLCFNCIMF